MFKTEGKPILESALGRTNNKESHIQWSTEHLSLIYKNKAWYVHFVKALLSTI
jgi:hypothetical protein